MRGMQEVSKDNRNQIVGQRFVDIILMFLPLCKKICTVQNALTYRGESGKMRTYLAGPSPSISRWLTKVPLMKYAGVWRVRTGALMVIVMSLFMGKPSALVT